jgi:hypothetical protein
VRFVDGRIDSDEANTQPLPTVATPPTAQVP